MRLINNMKITGTLKCESGLHIGGSAEQIEIGGVDLPIIKHPVTGEPYIPGSSFKGKMRSQLERKAGKMSGNGEPCNCGNETCIICKVFGAHKNTRHKLGPTRLIVRDACFSEKTRTELENHLKDKGSSYIEKKIENTVNRMQGTAAHPRSQERVPAGAEFDMELVLQLFDIDGDGQDFIEFIKEGLRQVQDTYLGGGGSRGSGKVSFSNLEIDGQGFSL